MPIAILLTITVCLLGISGCTTKQVYQGLYEGVRVRNQLQTTPAERAGKPEPFNYQEYEIQRNKRLEPPISIPAKQ